jgi:hypothetical protein
MKDIARDIRKISREREIEQKRQSGPGYSVPKKRTKKDIRRAERRDKKRFDRD